MCVCGRDQMKDWCDALEKTLHSLGILKVSGGLAWSHADQLWSEVF